MAYKYFVSVPVRDFYFDDSGNIWRKVSESAAVLVIKNGQPYIRPEFKLFSTGMNASTYVVHPLDAGQLATMRKQFVEALAGVVADYGLAADLQEEAPRASAEQLTPAA